MARPYERDKTGAPQLFDSLVLFLDVLGASDMATSADAQRQLKVLDRAVAAAKPHSQGHA